MLDYAAAVALGDRKGAKAELRQVEGSGEAMLEDDVLLAEKGAVPGGEVAKEAVVGGEPEV